MSMKKVFIVFFAFVTVSLHSACEREIEYDVSQHETKLVVNALFNPDSVWQIQLSKTLPVINATSTPEVEDANVILTEAGNPNLNALPFSQNLTFGASLYKTTTSYTPTAGTTYSLNLSKSGFSDVTAIGTVPNKPSLDPPTLVTQSQSNFEYKGKILVELNDPAGEENYYHLILRRPIITVTGGVFTIEGYNAEPFLLTNVAKAEDLYIEGFLFTDETFDGTTKTLNLDINTSFSPLFGLYDHFFIEVRAVDKNYYDYFVSVNEQYYSPQNKYVEIHTNITNGLGIFAGYNAATQKVPFQ